MIILGYGDYLCIAVRCAIIKHDFQFVVAKSRIALEFECIK